MKPINLLNVNEELHKILYTNRKGEELMKIDSETEGALNDLLDTVRDKIIEQNGQVLDWYVHADTDAEQIVIGFYVHKEDKEISQHGSIWNNEI